MSTQPESRLQRRIRARLEAEFPRSFWFKVHGGPFTKRGIPDLCGVVEGYPFAFEAKRPGELPSAIQVFTIDAMVAAGYCACVIESPEQAVAVVRERLTRGIR